MPTIQTIVAETFLSKMKKSLNEAILRNGPRILGRVGFLLLCFHLSTSASPAQSVISTAAGSGTFGFSGDGGPATSATLRSPHGVAVDSQGNLYFADRDNNRIRKVTPGGIITTVAGNGTAGSGGDGGPATSAQLRFPLGVAVDGQGNLFIADRDNGRIRKVTAAGVISTVAGSGVSGFSGDGGQATSARLSGPESVAVDAAGNVYITDTFNVRVRKVTTDGVISTVAGSGVSGFNGDSILATSARLAYPCGIAVDASGNIFIADRDNSRIRQVAPSGVISTVAGNGTFNFTGDGGPALSATLSSPMGVAVDTAGNLFIADRDNERIRKVGMDGIISTVAGNGTFGFGGDGGPALSAQLLGPRTVAVSSDGGLFIGDRDNNRVRKVQLIVTVPTLTTVSPNAVVQGTTVDVTLKGTSFFSPVVIDAGADIAVSNILIPDDITINARLTIASNAVLGQRTLSVTTNLGTSGLLSFSVVAPPTLTSISPQSGEWGASPTITLSGSSFFPGMSINAGPGIAISNVSVLNSTSASATFTIAAGATTGARDISVSLFGTTSNVASFVVNSAPPTITGIGPIVRRGSKVTVALSGTNFVSPLTVAPVTDVGVSNVTVTSATSASALFAVGAAATLGDHTIVVSTSEGASNTLTFQVLPTGQQDLNGDGNFDLLWNNSATSETATWLMNGLTASNYASLFTDSNWKVIGTPDLNGDGKSDLLWYNAAIGQTAAWLMNGPNVLSFASLLTDPNRSVTTTADLNGDGKSDLIWYNAATGQTSAWLMNGLSLSSSSNLLTNPSWKVIGAADFNRDGKSDLLWYNAATGQTVAWLMNGLSATSFAVLLTNPDWKITAAPDLNGDGKSDLLWYNAVSGQSVAWLMDGLSPTSFALLLSDLNWKITATPDLNGDGKSDLLWYNAATGQTVAWLMDGLSATNFALLLSDFNWKITATPDLNGDANSDLLWYNAATGQTVAWLMNGLSVSSTSLLLTDPYWKTTATFGFQR